MAKLLIKNIGLLRGITTECRLRGRQMDVVGELTDAWLLSVDGLIADYGSMDSCPASDFDTVDARGAIVTPTFCDSHTHLVYAGSREGEFIDKINGLSYEEIAARGGGILNSARRLADTPDEELYEAASRRLQQAMAMGTGAIEIKSGYGLTLEGEMKMLRVIKRLRADFPMIAIRSTFLGAHAVGLEFTGRQGEYVDYIIQTMIPEIGRQGLADFVDVFCDRGFFTPDETSRIIQSAAEWGMRAKIHGDELAASGGTQVAVAHGAMSVDHLERAGITELELLAGSETVATMLPGASFFLGMPYGDACKAINAGCTLALASDWNPGSSPSGSMPFVMALGCIKMRLTPDRAFNAVTLNGAAAMGIGDEYGSIARGKAASLIIYKPYVETPAYIPYAYSEPLIDKVILRGCVLD